MTNPTFGLVEVEKHLPASRARAFEAFADATQREQWGAPSDTAAFIVERDEFRVGGCDLTRCGDAADPRILVTTHYHRIEESSLIVATEVIDNDGQRVAVTQKTVELVDEDDECTCKVTVQVCSFVGEEMVTNTEHGQNGSLDHLASWLQSK